MPNPWLEPERARTWTGEGRANNPLRQEQADVLLRLSAESHPRRILDLGCGPGEIGERFLARFPGAAWTGVDEAPEVLERARARFEPHAGRTRLLQSPLQADWTEQAPGPFDLAVAVQTVHHLETEEKRDLFARVLSVLRPGGLFLMSEPVQLEAPQLFGLYRALLDHARQRQGFEPLPPGYDLDAFHEQLERNQDRLETVADQLQWMRAAGFGPRACFWRHGNRAIFGGARPE